MLVAELLLPLLVINGLWGSVRHTQHLAAIKRSLIFNSNLFEGYMGSTLNRITHAQTLKVILNIFELNFNMNSECARDEQLDIRHARNPGVSCPKWANRFAVVFVS